MTVGLQNRCSTNWAMVADWDRLYKKRSSCQKILKIFVFFVSWCENIYFLSSSYFSMITLIITSDGYKHFQEWVETYLKRLEKNLVFKKLKPVKHTDIEYIRVKETLNLMETLKKSSGIIYICDERWKSMTTPLFSEMIETARNNSENITFVIGGSYGIDLELLNTIQHKLIRISDFVMPHSLALLVLLEQIYRSHEIIRWSGYHHE